MLSLKIYLDLILILIMLVGVLVSVAFLTLMERKVLGYIHLRLGPNKILYMGIMQPFSDAVKLFVKEFYSPWMSNYLIYYFSPIISLFLSLIIWFVMPLQMNLVSFNYSILFMIVVLSLGIYPLMISGWSSNSNYAMLGCLRAIAQVISYEVVLIFILLSLIFFINSLNFYFYGIYQYYIWFIFFFMWLSFCWFTCMMAETNRTPFDLAEGESELVSGFNIEYGSGSFALIFMAEYASILFMSLMFSVLFLGSSPESFFFYLKLCLMVFMFIWVRGLMPRCRYDKLMYLTWKIYLPISLNFLLFYLGIKLFLY